MYRLGAGSVRPDFRKFLLWAVGVGAVLGVLAVGIWWARAAYKSHVEQVATAKHRAAAACVKRSRIRRHLKEPNGT